MSYFGRKPTFQIRLCDLGGELDSRVRGNDEEVVFSHPSLAGRARAERGTEGCGANEGGPPRSGLLPATFPARGG